MFLINLDKLDCYSDDSCHGNGFCRQGRCMCPSEYNYKKDCSIYGCKYKNLVMEVLHGYILFCCWQFFCPIFILSNFFGFLITLVFNVSCQVGHSNRGKKTFWLQVNFRGLFYLFFVELYGQAV